MKNKISHKRHLLKAITWRIIGTIDTIILSYIISGSIKIGFSIGAFELLSKMILYYIHERVWYKSNFGVKKNNKIE